MTSWAKPGAKCVCTVEYGYKSDFDRLRAPNLPVKGKAYTVREVDVCGVTGFLVLVLEEVRNPVFVTIGEVGFNVEHFRPIVTSTRQADVALFAHHLTGAGALV